MEEEELLKRGNCERSILGGMSQALFRNKRYSEEESFGDEPDKAHLMRS